MAARFDHVVVNDRLETAVAEVAAILAGHRAAGG
jgi:guanylate kinase